MGILSWQSLLHLPQKTFSNRKQAVIAAAVGSAQTALDARLADYFLNRLPTADKVRILHDFAGDAVFLDIETTGLQAGDRITTIAALSEGHLYVFTRDIDLADFLRLLTRARLLVTFNGARFDLPFLRRCFGVDLTIPHLDLMPVLSALGFKGGQKRCEVQAKLCRQYSDGTDGAEAVTLWKRYEQKGDRDALRKLILYNAEDVRMLERLAVKAYSLSMATYPFETRLTPQLDVNWTPDSLCTSAL